MEERDGKDGEESVSDISFLFWVCIKKLKKGVLRKWCV
jgi:hypothetical protein